MDADRFQSRRTEPKLFTVAVPAKSLVTSGHKPSGRLHGLPFAQYFYTQATGTPTPPAVPSLRAIKVSIIAIGDQPDTQQGGYKGPGALGFTVMDSTAAAVSTTRPYHRRVFDFAVSLRDYTS